jgi:hypothetical protein
MLNLFCCRISLYFAKWLDGNHSFIRNITSWVNNDIIANCWSLKDTTVRFGGHYNLYLNKTANWGSSVSKPTGNRLDVSDSILHVFTARTRLTAVGTMSRWALEAKSTLRCRSRVRNRLGPMRIYPQAFLLLPSQRWKFVNAMNPHQDAPRFGSQAVPAGYRFHAKFYVPTEVTMEITVLRVVSPCSLIDFYRRFRVSSSSVVFKIYEPAVLPSVSLIFGICPRLCAHVSYRNG